MLNYTFHAPVEDGTFCDQCNSIDIYPLPEHNIFIHGMGFHLTFHFDVENLQCSHGWEMKLKTYIHVTGKKHLRFGAM